jgi:UDP-glucose 4-epimerase
MSRRNVLVTGASSPIGERLVKTLLEDSRVHRIIAVTGTDPATAPLHAHPRLRILQVDLRRERQVHDLLFGPAREWDIDVLCHTSMHRSARDVGKSVYAFNVEAVRAILMLGERHPTIRRLVLRSAGEVYQVQRDLPVLIGEDHPINMGGNAPQWVRDRVEADLTVCVRMGLSKLQIVVLRMAEALGPGTGSQLYDYLESPVCFRPAGYDPMVNVLSIDDTVGALQRAIHSDKQGVFNVPGADSLPLSAAIRMWGRLGLPIPGFWLTPLYRLRSGITGHEFRYGMNRRRFHYSGILDGARARAELGFVPCHPVSWPSQDR